MAFASVLRKSAKYLAPACIATACIATALNYSSHPVVNHPSSTAAKFRKANAADESLLRHLESKIQIFQSEVDAACGFPFKMEDKKCGKITLTREYNGELIKIDVDMKNLKDDQKDSSFPFVVSITKGDGPWLEFLCTAMADKIVIDDLNVNDYGKPEFYLGEKLKEDFLKYLEMRGIEASTSNSLHKYMMSYKNNCVDVNRNRVGYFMTLKKFVEK
ncbi:Mitochondrial glycoprotein family protein [Corchorus capsularis]|uniref:Mitochondrial glycoprotein family protein n=1 Tax=Corchorus capsularis TaxID=210143 RepID=A0A1R3GM91_COCAP|nr:Mitochondrial glycoprotein family protein [Corchorus capsularis]